jgi:hypothetical protein
MGDRVLQMVYEGSASYPAAHDPASLTQAIKLEEGTGVGFEREHV